MRRQEITTEYTQALSYQSEGMARVDPHHLAKYFQTADIRAKAADLAGFGEVALFGAQVPGKVQLKDNHVLVECHLQSGLPLIVRVPLSYYRGIGARFVVSKREGNPVVCILELVHQDPYLTVPVLVSTDLEEAAVDWQSWSKRFNLAMLHQPFGVDDWVSVADSDRQLGGISIRPQKPRRHHAQFADRRPRFLTRRKTGSIKAQMPDLSGREIIARN